jgi:hypothetical protein
MARRRVPSKATQEQTDRRAEPSEPAVKERTYTSLESDSTPTYYSNNAQIATSVFDFRVIFGEIVKADEEEIVVRTRATVFLSPQHAKAFANVLSQKIRDYEQRYGEITLTIKAADDVH